MKNMKHGVSLMTLIITIVIMSILTGTIIISITNSNTIDNAKDAVKRYTLAEVNQFANIAYGEAVMDKLTNTEDILKFIKAELKEYGIDIRYYKIALNGNKVTVANRESEPWRFKKDSNGENAYVTNEDITLSIGDIVNYDETKGGTKTGLTNVDWRVLGANEDGDLILIASDNVQQLTLIGQEGYITGIDKLNKISREYGYGEGAAYARSIMSEDIDRLLQISIVPYYEKRRFYWEGDETPYYEVINSDGIVETRNTNYKYRDGFYCNDTYSPYPGTNISGKQFICEVEIEAYANYIDVENTAIEKTLSLYNENIYWIANKISFTGDLSTLDTRYRFTIKLSEEYRHIGEDEGMERALFSADSGAEVGPIVSGVRPVVILNSNTELTKASDGVWNIK